MAVELKLSAVARKIDADIEFENEDENKLTGLLSLYQNAPQSVSFKKLRKRLIRQAREAIDQYGMVKPDQKWLICLSGGKDSYSLLALLMELKWRGLLPVELLACNLDQAQPGFPPEILPEFLEKHAIPYRIEREDTYSIVKEKIPEHQTYCALCSRLRRAILYRIAREENCQAIVLGHHREDVLETFFLNLFHGGKLTAMPPKLLNEEGDLHVLRPLVFCAENDLQKFSDALQFPIIPCNLCGSQDGLQRQVIKEMLSGWEEKHPGRKGVMLNALTNTNASHLLDPKLFDFMNL